VDAGLRGVGGGHGRYRRASDGLSLQGSGMSGAGDRGGGLARPAAGLKVRKTGRRNLRGFADSTFGGVSFLSGRIEIHPTNRMKVLAVEDDPVALAVLTRTLRKLGHEVVTASDGDEALRMLETEPVRMMVSDWT